MTVDAACHFHHWTGSGPQTADVNTAHGLHFDHRLGHVPGMMLYEIGLNAIRRASAASPSVSCSEFERTEAVFVGLASLKRFLTIETTPSHAGWLATLSQGGKVCARIFATPAPDAAPTTTPTGTGDGALPFFSPIDRSRVRKLDSANVFLGDAADGNGFRLRPANAADCTLETSRDGRVTSVYLAESFLQLCRTDRADDTAGTDGIPASKEILTQFGGQVLRPVGDVEPLWIDFGPVTFDPWFPAHGQAKRRTAIIKSRDEIVALFFCDAVLI